jgi:thiol:disulfide interchange protein
VLKKIFEAMCHPAWLTDYPKALSEATSKHLLVLAVFSGYSWCSHCQALKQEVFDTCQFGFWALSKGLILLDVDFPSPPNQAPPQNVALLQKYQVAGFPTVIGLNADGSERGRVVGYANGTGATAWINQFENAATLNMSSAIPFLNRI